jgi:hypothetical protein
MHQTGFAIMECLESRLPRLLIGYSPLYAKFAEEAEDAAARLDPTEVDIRNFEERWIGASGFLSQYTRELDVLADFTGEHAACERRVIFYVTDILEAHVRQELGNLRSAFEMLLSIRRAMGLSEAA